MGSSGLGRLVIAGLLAGLAGCAGPDPADRSPVRVLQLNLCNSGIAGCHTGRSTAEAAAVIGAERPDLVTLNEICEDDLRALGEAAVRAFQPALDRRTGQAWRCGNGERFGIGIVSRWPAVPGSPPGGGTFAVQDGADPEDRAWLCVDVVAGSPITACTAHLADTDADVAAAQCRSLFGTVVPTDRPVVVAGDLNLRAGDPGLRSCLPAGSGQVDDGGPQHVVGVGYTVAGSRLVDLRGSTDHPGLLVTLTGARG